MIKITNQRILMTIKLGTGIKTADGFYQAITDVGGQVSDEAKDIMGKPDFVNSISKNPVKLDIYMATTEEILGKKGKNGILKAIYAGIVGRMGGELLPAEAGPQLRSQYTSQPKGDLLIAMKAISDSIGTLSIFSVKCDDAFLWLNTHYGHPVSVWSSDACWLFARRH